MKYGSIKTKIVFSSKTNSNYTPIISNNDFSFSKDLKKIKQHNEAHLQTKEQAAMKFKQGCSTKHSPNGLSQPKQTQSVESMPMKSIKGMRDGAGTGAESVHQHLQIIHRSENTAGNMR